MAVKAPITWQLWRHDCYNGCYLPLDGIGVLEARSSVVAYTVINTCNKCKIILRYFAANQTLVLVRLHRVLMPRPARLYGSDGLPIFQICKDVLSLASLEWCHGMGGSGCNPPKSQLACPKMLFYSENLLPTIHVGLEIPHFEEI